jgi:hypothetical protein
LSAQPIAIAGISIPSDAPPFLAVLAVHVLAGLICVIAGVAAMTSRKARGRHPWAGSIYYWSLSVVFASMATLSVARWAEDYDLFALGILSFLAASVGRQARRRRWRNWARFHVVGMGLSYILLVTAFYVDNGKSLPLWRDLPQAAFWILPSLLGGPLILHALWRHPLARQGG